MRPVRDFVCLFRLSHSTSKIADEKLRRGGVICKAVRWREGSEKNISAKNIFVKNIFTKNIFVKNNCLQKIFPSKIFLLFFSIILSVIIKGTNIAPSGP